MWLTFGAPLILFVVAAIFFALVVLDQLRASDKPNPARKTWLRVAFIFSAVAVALMLLNAMNA